MHTKDVASIIMNDSIIVDITWLTYIYNTSTIVVIASNNTSVVIKLLKLLKPPILDLIFFDYWFHILIRREVLKYINILIADIKMPYTIIVVLMPIH